MNRFAIFCILGLALLVSLRLPSGPAWGQDQTPPDPPQFVSAPIHAPEQLQERINGWLTFAATRKPGGGSGGGTTSPSTASFAPAAQTATAPVDVVNALDSYQGEPMVTAITGGFVGGFNWIYPGSCSATLANCAPGTTLSLDGLIWKTSRVPIAGNLLGFDPSLALDAGGAIYEYAYGVCGGSCGTGNLMVATSSDGITWTGHTATPPQGGVFDDKPWIAANPKTAGRAYLAWDRNQANNQTIYVSTTGDSGVTWSRPVKVNDGTSKFERVIYAMPAVDPPSGTVYVVWMDYARKALFVDKSTNGGQTWGTDKKVASLAVTFVDIGCNGGRSMTPAPYIAVDGQGVVYVTYADWIGYPSAGTGMDVYLVYLTTDGKLHGPFKLNDDGSSSAAHQYNPAMSVTSGGVVHVSWLDRRNDSANCLTDTYSTEGTVTSTSGVTFTPNIRITPASSNFNGNPNGPGDYTGIVAYPVSSTTAALPLFPTHLATDIAKETGSGGGFEVYGAIVSP